MSSTSTPLVEAGNAEHGEPPDDRWTSLRSFWLAAAALSVVLFALLPVVNNGYIALPDEGVYSSQAAALANGSWSSPRPAADVDTTGMFDSVHSTAIIGDTRVPYGRHPLYGLILSVGYQVGGSYGLLAISVLGTIGAAVAAGLIGRRIRPEYGIPTLGVTALLSPFVFTGYMVAAHTLAAMFCGALTLLLMQAIFDRRWWRLVPAVLSAVLLVNIRTEGIIAVAVIGGTAGLMALPIPRRRRTDWGSGFAAAAILAAGLVAYVIDSWASRVVLSQSAFGSMPLQSVLGEESGPLKAAWTALLRPWQSGENASIPILLGLFCVLLAVVTLRLLPRRPLLSIALCVLAGLAAIWCQFAGVDLITGLLPAMPLLIFAFAWLTKDTLRIPEVQLLLGASVLGIVLLVVTVYSDGGATQWGGRFFQVLIPLLAPLTVAGMHQASLRVGRREAQIAAAGLIAFALSISVLAMRTNIDLRRGNKHFVDGIVKIIGSSGRGGVTILANLTSDGTARVFWQHDQSLQLLMAGDIRNVYPLLGDAIAAGKKRAFVVTTVDMPTLRYFDRGLSKRIKWKVIDVTPVPKTNYRVIEFGVPTES